MILETERLILRPWEESDAEECFKYASDPRVGPAAGWPVHTDVENSRRIIRDILSKPETYAIVLKETGLPVGSIGLFRGDLAQSDDELELGYWVGVPYWGRGIAPEAGREMLRHAFLDLGMSRVWCGYYDGNEKSKRVQEKLGFVYHHTSDDVPVPQMGETRRGHSNLMTREDWLKKHRGMNILRCSDRSEWRRWLSEHFETDSEVWFVFPSKDSGEQGVSYNDAVEEALCFGWIDGRAGTLDASHGLRRFTPRRKGSPYSRPNIERLILLNSQGAIHPKIRPSVESVIADPFVFPEDILEAIRSDGEAWERFNSFSEPYKRIRVAYIDAARKRPGEFARRLSSFVKKCRENKLISGYGGIGKYYGVK